MKLTDHEEKLLLRALDKASSPAEAEKAAQALIESLRARGISGYDILGGTRSADAANPMHTPRGPSTGSERRYGNGRNTAPPPQPDRKWDFMPEQPAPQAPQTITHSSKIAIFIVALTFFFICSVLAFLVLPNRVFMILIGGFTAQWLWRALWRPQPGKIASTIGITILALICFLLFYTLAILLIHNAGFAVLLAGFAACWFWRRLRRVNFLGN
jgi:hypothetical protein